MILEKCKALWKILVKLLGDCNPTYIAKKRFKKKTKNEMRIHLNSPGV